MAGRTSEATIQVLERSAGALATAAHQHLETTLDWYRDLEPEDRSWVSLIAQAGIRSFIRWCRDEGRVERVTADVFGNAPRDLTRSITLTQTLDLVRGVVDAVEGRVGDIAAPGEEAELALTVLRYSREIAFAAAQLYADAAEERGAWDARLESLVVDAVLRGEADDEVTLRATALGWAQTSPVLVVVGRSPERADVEVEALRRTATRAGWEPLIAVQGSRLVAILGGENVTQAPALIAGHFGEGPVVVGPTVPRLFAAGRSARAALTGFQAAPAWDEAPRIVHADDLLPERVLIGDRPARSQLVERIHTPLSSAGGSLLETASAYLASGRSLEATARALFCHPNTVRYRLGRIADVTGYDLTRPRDAHVVTIALSLGRLLNSSRRWRTSQYSDE
ncbi:PucR family transcriptional regulator [Gephyromycinifex aptenodytis]|uniref:PucR family transcriptional regulator n=1 Tax=Gephyromycinifex aptenodytis TaxID=2716227 RepID=UPI001447DA95|nr:PucR family transcriptional regulator [Gephyromycinifex aptenodytis]